MKLMLHPALSQPANLHPELSRLWRVRRTVMQMLTHRNYIVPRDLEEQQVEEFKNEMKAVEPERVRTVMMLVVQKKGDDSQKLCVFFGRGLGQKIGTEHLKQYQERMVQEDANKAIIIEDGGITAHCKTTINQINSEGKYYFETFKEAELLVNITEHVLVPKHVPLTAEQIDELIKRYNLRKQQLPRMQVTDPIARYYGLKRGDVVKIIRHSETAGRYVTYRAVI